MTSSSRSPGKNKHGDVDNCSIDDVPFSVLTKLFSKLRNTKSARGGRSRGPPSLSRASILSLSSKGETRKTVLSHGWLELCDHVKRNDERLQERLMKRSREDFMNNEDNDDDEFIPGHLLAPEDALKAISLIVPDLDPIHGSIGLKEIKLAEAFIGALDLVPDGEDAQWLKHYREQAYWPKRRKNDMGVAKVGDFALVLQAVLFKRCRPSNEPSELTIGLVWNALDLLSQSTKFGRKRRFLRTNYNEDDEGFIDVKRRAAAAAKGGITGNEDEKKSAALISLVEKGTALEVAEVVRIILKEMNMNLSQDAFLAWFHPDAKQHFRQIHDVRKLLSDCYNPNFDIGEAAVHLGRYASVMLTMRPSKKNLPTICEKLLGEGDGALARDIAREKQDMIGMKKKKKKMDGMEYTKGHNGSDEDNDTKPYFIMEPKLDGERLQLHKWKKEYGKTESSTKDGDNNEREKGGNDSDDDDEDHSGAVGFQENRLSSEHKGFRVKTFSRNGLDSSAMYASALRSVILDGVKTRDVILDGEVTIWDDVKQHWVRFEHMREITTAIADKRPFKDGQSYTLRYVVFDVLFIEQGKKKSIRTSNTTTRTSSQTTTKCGKQVMRLPLHQRRAILNKLIPVRCGRDYMPGVRTEVEVIKMQRGHSVNELTDALQYYHDAMGYEGVIAKSPNKEYALAERNDELCVKLKPDYFDGGIKDIDVLILGAKYSGSKGNRMQRAGKLSSFLIGVRADDDVDGNDDSGDEGKWIPIASVGTGFSDDVLKQIQEKLEPDWLDFNRRELPDHFVRKHYPSTLLSEVAKWVQPRKSIVITAQAFELNRKYDMLRFPRMVRVRWDKLYHDVISMSHLKDLDENRKPAFVRPDTKDPDDVAAQDGDETTLEDEQGVSSARGATRRKRRRGSSWVEIDSVEEAALKIAREEGHEIRGGKRGGRMVIGGAEATDVSHVELVSEMFAGVTFLVVIEGDNLGAQEVNRRKRKLEVIIHKLGGTLVQNLTRNTDFVICEHRNGRRVRRMRDLVEGGTRYTNNKESKLSTSSVIGSRQSASGTGTTFTRPPQSSTSSQQSYHNLSVVLSGWILACETERIRVRIKPEWVFAANEQLQKQIYQQVDRFGDPWDKDTDMQTFQACLSRRNDCDPGLQDLEQVLRGDAEVASVVQQCEQECGLVFSGVVMLVPTDEGEDENVDVQGCVEAFGGVVVTSVSGVVTHVLETSCNRTTTALEEEFKGVRLAGRADKSNYKPSQDTANVSDRQIKRVDRGWVTRCVEEQRLVD